MINDCAGQEIRLWAGGSSQIVSAKEAIAGFSEGGAIYIPKVERTYDDLRHHIIHLCTELGVPQASGSCSLFMSPAGAEVPLHFDHDFGFNMLIQGRKCWRLAKNEHVIWPTTGFDASKIPSVELRAYIERPLPAEFPTAPTEVDIGPGAVCFLPRGFWHSTYAYEECIALDFAIDPPSWADYVANLVRAQLLKVPSARQSVIGASSSSRFQGDYLRLLDTIVPEIQAFVQRSSSWF